jgi:Lactate racemase N-terminal domain
MEYTLSWRVRPGALPPMCEVRQRRQPLPAINVRRELARQLPAAREHLAALPAGARIAVAVGSRGVANLPLVVAAIVAELKDVGLEPFVVAAMGSHGGGTAEGQLAVLADRAITRETVGAEVIATSEAVRIGEVEGIPLYLDRLASEADAIIPINRVKPHTDFVGTVESGLMKMMVIGLGKQAGADYYHRLGVVRGLDKIILTAGRALLERCRVPIGVALVENELHETALLRVVPGDEFEVAEEELLCLARERLPRLPLDDIDLLIVDEIGKEISGSGLDPNVTGRPSAPWMARRDTPRISRIFVRDLSRGTAGNGTGLGIADAIAARVLRKLDMQETAVNVLTGCCPEEGRIPLTFENDQGAIAALLTTIRPHTLEDLRLVHVRNTLELDTVWVSDACIVSLLEGFAQTKTPPSLLAFDVAGNLISPFPDTARPEVE